MEEREEAEERSGVGCVWGGGGVRHLQMEMTGAPDDSCVLCCCRGCRWIGVPAIV